MTGTVTRTAAGCALQLQITRTADNTVAASWSGTCTFAELDNLTGIRRASLELLGKMGVTVTERTRTELAEAAEPNHAKNHANARAALARGITAQQRGAVIEALSYYIQSNNYDSTLAETTSRLNVLSTNITSGNTGQSARDDLEWRDRWVARLRECEEWYAEYMKAAPPCYLVYSTEVQQGPVDYQRRTVPLSITAKTEVAPVIQWYTTPNQVVQTVREGLLATGRAQNWGLDKWAYETSVSAENPFTDHVSSFSAEFEILNSENKSLGKETRGFPCGSVFSSDNRFKSDNRDSMVNRTMPIAASSTDVVFPEVDPYDITGSLTVRISRIDGLQSEQAAGQKNISILTSAEYNNRASGNRASGNVTAGVFHRSGSSSWSWGVLSEYGGGNQGSSTLWSGIVVIPYGTVRIEGDLLSDRYDDYALMGVTIGANVTIGASGFISKFGYYSSYHNYSGYHDDGGWDSFCSYYNSNGKKAGTYICTWEGYGTGRYTAQWSFTPQ
jgi:hypothetical protein